MAKINQETIIKMRRLLASWTVFYQKAHTFHWDLTGQNFLELHKFFEVLYNESVDNADSVAERLRQIGEKIGLTLQQAVDDSSVDDDNSAGTAEAMVTSLVGALAQITVLQTEIFTESEEQEDYVTMDLMTKLSAWTEFKSWFLSSQSGNENVTKV